MSAVQKLTGTLALGPVQYAREVAAQPVHDLEAAARYLASYIRAHAIPLNKLI